MASRVWESTVIDAPLEKVWEVVRPVDFRYSPAVVNCSVEAGHRANEVGVVHVVSYKDGVVQKVKVTEISEVSHSVCWDLIHSVPEVKHSAASYNVRLRRISQGNSTFVEWTVDFASDAEPGVLADATYKARDHFKFITEYVKRRMLAEARLATFQVGGHRLGMPAIRRQLSDKSEQLRKLFETLDKNHNGTLDQEEFAFALNKLFGENLSDHAVRILLTAADQNGDRVITYEEFLKFVKSEDLDDRAVFVGKQLARNVRLHYFNARGRGELLRLIMKEGGQVYEDVRYDFKDKAKMLEKSPMGQVPYIEIDGKTLAQSGAIERYLGTILNLYGTSLTERTRIDMILEGLADVAKPYMGAAFSKEDERKAKFEAFFKEHLPLWNGYLEAQLKANPRGGWFVGHQISIADIHFFTLYFEVLNHNPNALKGFPQLEALYKAVGSRPNIAAWVKARPPSPF